jgi:plastocyanin
MHSFDPLRRRPLARALLVATAIALLLVVNLPSSRSLAEEPDPPSTHEVKITGFAFDPQTLTIQVGDTVIWNNTDPVIHTLWFVLVADGSTYMLSDPILPNSTWSHAFDAPVALQYYDFNRLWITGFVTAFSIPPPPPGGAVGAGGTRHAGPYIN